MGFFSTLNKIIHGKPLFETEEQREIAKERVAEQTQALNNGRKTIPIAQIEHIEVDNNGDRMEVRCHIRNESSEHDIELDKIRVLGVVRELDTRLRPRESRELVVYSGKWPNNRNYGTAELNYKDMLGDYFQARCAVEFKQEPDNTYSIYRIRLAGPIKDIQ
jgi:hypothetical protein